MVHSKPRVPSFIPFKNIGFDVKYTNAYYILMSVIGYTTNSYRRGMNLTVSKLSAVIIKVTRDPEETGFSEDLELFKFCLLNTKVIRTEPNW